MTGENQTAGTNRDEIVRDLNRILAVLDAGQPGLAACHVSMALDVLEAEITAAAATGAEEWSRIGAGLVCAP